MKTTIDLPDALMRAIKVRAAQQDRKIKDIMTELLEAGLSQSSGSPSRAVVRRVQVPLVQCGRRADAGSEMTPDRVADILVDQEADWAIGRDDAAV